MWGRPISVIGGAVDVPRFFMFRSARGGSASHLCRVTRPGCIHHRGRGGLQRVTIGDLHGDITGVGANWGAEVREDIVRDARLNMVESDRGVGGTDVRVVCPANLISVSLRLVGLLGGALAIPLFPAVHSSSSTVAAQDGSVSQSALRMLGSPLCLQRMERG